MIRFVEINRRLTAHAPKAPLGQSAVAPAGSDTPNADDHFCVRLAKSKRFAHFVPIRNTPDFRKMIFTLYNICKLIHKTQSVRS